MSKRYDPNIIKDICDEYEQNESELITEFIRSNEDFLDMIVFIHDEKITDLIESRFEKEFEAFTKYRYECGKNK